MQSLRRLCLLFLALLPSVSTFTQSSAQIDSMIRVCNRYQKTDSIKISMLLNLSKAYTKSSAEKGLAAADEAIQLASQLNDSVSLARGYFARSANLLQTGNFAEIIDLCNKGLVICIPRGLHLDIANLYNTLGGVYFYQGNYASAQEYFTKAYHSFQLAGDENGQTRTQINLGLISLKYRDFTKALQSFQTAVDILEKKGASPMLAQAYDNIGGVYSETSAYDQALEYYEKALAIDRATNNKIGMAMRIANIAIVYNRTADYLKALEYYQQALKLNEELGNQRSYANTLGNIGTVYVQLEDYQKAGQYFRDALDLSERQGNQTLIAQNLMNLGNNHFMLQEINQSETYYRRALRIYEDAAYEPGIMEAYAKLANIYGAQLAYATALDYFNQALSRAEALDNKGIMADCLCSIGDIISVAPDSLLARNNIRPEDRYAEAIRLEEKGLKILTESQILSRVLWCQNALSRTYEKAGDYIKAYEAFKQYFAIKDSLAGEETRKKFMRKEIEYEFEKKEASLRYEQQLTAEQLEKQKLFTLQQQQLLDLKEQALLLSNQEKDLHRLEYLKERAEKQKKEQALYLAEKEKAYHTSELAVMAKEKALQLAALAQKNALIGWLATGVAALLLGGFALFFHQKQIQARKEVVVQTNFTHLLLENTEAERGRIARDLHDSVSHELLRLKNELKGQNENASAQIDLVIDDIRRISRNLHPIMLDNIGLKYAIESLCEQYMERQQLFVSVDIEEYGKLPQHTELQLFRIVQEALSNIHKYAHADACMVRLYRSPDQLNLEIRDNGRGFDVDRTLQHGKAFGLHSMIQRSKSIGGQAVIRSSPQGTVIEISTPLT